MERNQNTSETAEILKRMRHYLRKTQVEVAQEVKICLSAYQKFESGERDLRSGKFQIVCGILETLDLDPSMFYRGEYHLADITCPVEVIEEPVYARKTFRIK